MLEKYIFLVTKKEKKIDKSRVLKRGKYIFEWPNHSEVLKSRVNL